MALTTITGSGVSSWDCLTEQVSPETLSGSSMRSTFLLAGHEPV